MENSESYGHYARKLTKEEYDRIKVDTTVSEWNRNKLEIDARKNWDKFYLRNQTNFFRNRNWTLKEFKELELSDTVESDEDKPILLELGSGCGNFLFPLIEAETKFFIFACDFSPRAINFIRSNELYDESKCKAFLADVTNDEFEKLFREFSNNQLANVVSLIYVLSAINPDKMKNVLSNCYKVLKPSGTVIFRDYGLYDHTMIRFKPENKISENFYTRIDGTRAFYFSEEFISDLAVSAGFDVIENRYILREIKNIKEKIAVPRIFIQSKFVKPISRTE